MREIKFRAWDKKNKEMSQVVEMIFNQYGGIDVRTSRRMDINEDCLGKDSLMQYTGLHDKNGKEIYEGDITRVHNEYGQIISERVTEFKELIDEFEGFKIKIGMGFNINSDSASESEVIGNIYENPELSND